MMGSPEEIRRRMERVARTGSPDEKKMANRFLSKWPVHGAGAPEEPASLATPQAQPAPAAPPQPAMPAPQAPPQQAAPMPGAPPPTPWDDPSIMQMPPTNIVGDPNFPVMGTGNEQPFASPLDPVKASWDQAAQVDVPVSSMHEWAMSDDPGVDSGITWTESSKKALDVPPVWQADSPEFEPYMHYERDVRTLRDGWKAMADALPDGDPEKEALEQAVRLAGFQGEDAEAVQNARDLEWKLIYNAAKDSGGRQGAVRVGRVEDPDNNLAGRTAMAALDSASFGLAGAGIAAATDDKTPINEAMTAHGFSDYNAMGEHDRSQAALPWYLSYPANVAGFAVGAPGRLYGAAGKLATKKAGGSMAKKLMFNSAYDAGLDAAGSMAQQTLRLAATGKLGDASLTEMAKRAGSEMLAQGAMGIGGNLLGGRAEHELLQERSTNQVMKDLGDAMAPGLPHSVRDTGREGLMKTAVKAPFRVGDEPLRRRVKIAGAEEGDGGLIHEAKKVVNKPPDRKSPVARGGVGAEAGRLAAPKVHKELRKKMQAEDEAIGRDFDSFMDTDRAARKSHEPAGAFAVAAKNVLQNKNAIDAVRKAAAEALAMISKVEVVRASDVGDLMARREGRAAAVEIGSVGQAEAWGLGPQVRRAMRKAKGPVDGPGGGSALAVDAADASKAASKHATGVEGVRKGAGGAGPSPEELATTATKEQDLSGYGIPHGPFQPIPEVKPRVSARQAEEGLDSANSAGARLDPADLNRPIKNYTPGRSVRDEFGEAFNLDDMKAGKGVGDDIAEALESPATRARPGFEGSGRDLSDADFKRDTVVDAREPDTLPFSRDPDTLTDLPFDLGPHASPLRVGAGDLQRAGRRYKKVVEARGRAKKADTIPGYEERNRVEGPGVDRSRVNADDDALGERTLPPGDAAAHAAEKESFEQRAWIHGGDPSQTLKDPSPAAVRMDEQISEILKEPVVGEKTLRDGDIPKDMAGAQADHVAESMARRAGIEKLEAEKAARILREKAGVPEAVEEDMVVMLVPREVNAREHYNSMQHLATARRYGSGGEGGSAQIKDLERAWRDEAKMFGPGYEKVLDDAYRRRSESDGIVRTLGSDRRTIRGEGQHPGLEGSVSDMSLQDLSSWLGTVYQDKSLLTSEAMAKFIDNPKVNELLKAVRGARSWEEANTMGVAPGGMPRMRAYVTPHNIGLVASPVAALKWLYKAPRHSMAAAYRDGTLPKNLRIIFNPDSRSLIEEMPESVQGMVDEAWMDYERRRDATKNKGAAAVDAVLGTQIGEP